MKNISLNCTLNYARRLILAARFGLAMLVLATTAQAQIVLQDGSSATLIRTNGASFGTDFTVTAGANVLVFMVAAHGNVAPIMPSLSWGAQPLTLAVSTNAGSSYTGSAIYYLFNPTPGAQTISGTVTGGTVDNTFIQAYTLSGVDTTSPPLIGAAARNGAPPIANSVTNIHAGSWAAVTIGNGGTGATTLTVTPSGTVNAVNNTSDGGRNIEMGYVSGLSAGISTFTDNFSGNNKFTLVEAIFAPLPSPPVIGVQPLSNSVVFAGITVNLKVTAFGIDPLTYQWMRNGTNLLDSAGYISGSLTNVLTITGVSAADASPDYQVIVTDPLGSVTSSVANISITLPNAYDTTALTYNPFAFYTFSETGDPQTGSVVAYDSMGSFNGTYGAGGVADAFGSGALNGANGIAGPRATADGMIGFPDTNTALGTIEGNFPADSYVTVPPLNLNNGAGTNVLTITAWINPNGVQIPAAGIVFSRSGTTVAGLNFSSKVGGDGFSTGNLSYTWNNDGATYGWNSGLTPPQNMWSLVSLVVTPTNATLYVLNANGLTYSVNNYTNVPQKFEGPTLIGADSLATTRNFTGSIDEVALFNQSLTQSQLIAMYAAGSGVTLTPAAPVIVTEPTWSSPIYPGLAASASAVTVNAAGFQWMAGSGGVYTNVVNDGTNISGATTATLTISNVQPVNASDYVVVVTNAIGAVTSSPPATLTITPSGSATNLTLNFGGTAIFQGAGADWNTVNNWNPGGLAATTYLSANPGSSFEVVPGAQLRTPVPSTNLYYTFPGVSLTIDGNGVFVDTAGAGETTVGQLKIKAPGSAQIVTNYFPLLVMAGGQIDNGGSGSGVPQVINVIQGTMNVISNTPIYEDAAGVTNRPFQIDAFLEGNGSIEYHDIVTTNDALFSGSGLLITGNTNTFSGTWNVVQGPLIGAGNNSLGTNTITVGTNGVLETLYPINNTNSSLILNGRVFLTQNDTFQNLVINGVSVAPGYYPIAALNAAYPTNFPLTFTTVYGSTATTASGSINVGNVPVVLPPPTPHITRIGLSGTTLSVSATNGLAGGSWALLQSTNVALSLSLWQTNTTGMFDSSGNLSTNIANTATNQQEFYILKQ